MANYQIAFNLATKVVTIQAKGDALPTGSKKIGGFAHADVEPNLTDLEFDVNHVFFHHVRHALYHTSSKTGVADYTHLLFPDNITDLAGIHITTDTDYVALTTVTAAPATVTLAKGATQQITNTFAPTNASNKAVTYTSNNTARATVSSTGLITAGQTSGAVNITVTSDDGAKTSTVVVTVS